MIEIIHGDKGHGKVIKMLDMATSKSDILCPNCQSHVLKKLKKSYKTDENEKYEHFICLECGLIFFDERPAM